MRRLPQKRLVRAGVVAGAAVAALAVSGTVRSAPVAAAVSGHHRGRHHDPAPPSEPSAAPATSLTFGVPRDGRFHHLATVNGIAVAGLCGNGTATHASLSFEPTSGATSLRLSGTWTRDGTVVAPVDVEGSQMLALGASHVVDTAVVGDNSDGPQPVARFDLHLVNPSDRSACTGYGLVIPGR